ncbi:hypothetical protein NDU88_009304 [Pleurodeles waltl]|uniref:Uncharacterized protein n=1 Tax=Pleurodeles waltl TaxID=8319 RepID=A0AAV7PVH2_PLEWA|nr:hypothetical protein NDU88_009304 [Pleurodeles waltl]
MWSASAVGALKDAADPETPLDTLLGFLSDHNDEAPRLHAYGERCAFFRKRAGKLPELRSYVTPFARLCALVIMK